MPCRRLLAAALILTSATAGAAQTDTSDRPTFRSGVDLVRFDVRVSDEAGRPITDLRSDEIEIYDNGRLLPVVLFQRITEPAGVYEEAALRAVTAEVSSNDAFPRGHLYLLIFDQQHITPGNEQRARLAAEQFIRTRLRSSDRVALFALPGPGPQIGFTADKLRAIQELANIRGSYSRIVATPMGTMSLYEAHRIVHGDEKLTMDVMARMTTESGGDFTPLRVGANPPTVAAGDDPGIARRLVVENARTIVNQSDSYSRQLLQRLADVIAGFREIEGRKTVVFFSEGFFQDNLTRELEAVAAAAAQSYCVFYTFDLNQRGPALNEAYASDTVLASEIQARIAPMSTLAVETDGAMVVDAGARSDKVLDILANQARDYYLVGFTPSEDARASRGKYRRVTVKVKRSGAQVSARTGYALPPDAVVADRRKAINAVLSAPFAQQGLRLDYTTYVMKAPEVGRHRVVMSLNVDLPVRSKPTDTADVVFVARDVRDGSVVASGTDTIALPARARPGAATGSSAWRVQFNVPAGSYLMRTVVREPGGLMGSADRRLDVRPLDGPEIAVSDLVLGSALSALPVRPRASAGAGLSGVIEAYARTAVQMEQLAVTIQLRKHGVEGTVSSFPAEVLDAESSDGGFMRRVRFQMPLEGIATGDYIAHAVVRVNGEIVAERTRQLEVVEATTAGQTDTTGAVQERVSPADVVGGELGRRYVAELSQRAGSAAVREAARHASQGNWEQVELGLRHVTEEAGASVPALRGFALFVREDFAGAAAALAAALEADAQNALTAFFLGWAQEGAGEPRAALSAWRNAAYLDPTLVSAHIALADGYLRLSQPALAIQALRAGLAALPDSTELRDRLARLEIPRDMPSPSTRKVPRAAARITAALIPREARSRRARSEQQGATHGGASESERWQVVGWGPTTHKIR